MQRTDIFQKFGFAAESFNELFKGVDAGMIRRSNAEQYKEEDEFSPAGIWEILSRLYRFQPGDVIKANVGTFQDVLCVISSVKPDALIVHSTEWDLKKKCWQFQDKTIVLGNITSFIGCSFSKEAAIKNASKLH